MKQEKNGFTATREDLLQFYTGGPNEKTNSFFVKKEQLQVIC